MTVINALYRCSGIRVNFIVVSWLALLLAGCASAPTTRNPSGDVGPYEQLDNSSTPAVVGATHYSDPLQPINRVIFSFNHYSYRFLLTPLSRGYQRVIPKPVDNSIGNFFNNLREPLYSLNYLFQGQPKRLGNSLARFGVNSTVGLLGLFDPAEHWGLEKAQTGFDETLMTYGAGYGTYLVLPFLGPSDLRGLTDSTANYFLHPLKYIENQDAATGLLVADGFHRQVDTLARYPDVVENAEDPYIFVRNFYLQGVMRDSEAITRHRNDNQQLKVEKIEQRSELERSN